MSKFEWQLKVDALSESRVLAQILALKLSAGDVVELRGDLGVGKTALARELIRAIAADPDLEVPSPTYSIEQIYDLARCPVHHYDFYRLDSPDDANQLDVIDAAEQALVLIEWPERADLRGTEHCVRIDITEIENAGATGRVIKISAEGPIGDRLARAQAAWNFVGEWARTHTIPIGDVELQCLQGDASTRSYARVRAAEGYGLPPLLLMDSPRQPDGPPIRNNLPYSAIAHLAENIEPFIAIGAELARHGLSTPSTDFLDRRNGFALIEDLGGRVFGDEIGRGRMELAVLYRAAVDVLLEIRSLPVPEVVTGDGCSHRVPGYDAEALGIEIDLLLDWFALSARDEELAEHPRNQFHEAWQSQFARLLALGTGWVLRDYHSPNLIWLPDRSGFARVGLIDYQDAQVGHPAYDLVSLLQDARLDVPAAVEAVEIDRYCTTASQREPDFDDAEFRWAYALLGAQRATKLLGIFTRLSVRDGKHQYLRHIPRVTRYLRRNLEHAELREISAWFETHLPVVFDEQSAD